MNRPLRYVFLFALLLVAAIGAYALGVLLRPAPEVAGTALTNPVSVEGLALVDHHGAAALLADDYRGDVTLVFFGFTRCPDVCPLTMARLARIYEALGEPDGLQVVMVTVDPEYDTPEVLGRYVTGYHPEFVGLTGTSSDVAAAARTFFVGYSGLGRDIVHTDVVAVLDRTGALRYVYGQDDVMFLERDLPDLIRRL
ncbi:MAG: SCO family protein [Trueperaceae bacterium]